MTWIGEIIVCYTANHTIKWYYSVTKLVQSCSNKWVVAILSKLCYTLYTCRYMKICYQVARVGCKSDRFVAILSMFCYTSILVKAKCVNTVNDFYWFKRKKKYIARFSQCKNVLILFAYIFFWIGYIYSAYRWYYGERFEII